MFFQFLHGLHAAHSVVTLSAGLYLSTHKQLHITVAFLRCDNFFSSPWDSQHFMEFELLFSVSRSYPETDDVETWPIFLFQEMFSIYSWIYHAVPFLVASQKKSRYSIEYIWVVYLPWSYPLFMICHIFWLRPISPQCFFISLQWILKWLKLFASKLKQYYLCSGKYLNIN